MSMNRREFIKQTTGATAALAVGGGVVAGVKAEAMPMPVPAVPVPSTKDLEQRAAEWFWNQVKGLYGNPAAIEAAALYNSRNIDSYAQILRERRCKSIFIPFLPPLKALWIAEAAISAADPGGTAMFGQVEFEFIRGREVYCRMTWDGNVRETTITEQP